MLKEILFDKALARWGFNSQMAMLAEESSELAVSALHFLRYAKARDQALEDLAEELADTRLMIEQIIYIIPELERKVPIIEARKLARLAEILG